VAVVAFIVVTTGRDERVTREPIPQDSGPVGTESED